jgi:hypothetical protein
MGLFSKVKIAWVPNRDTNTRCLVCEADLAGRRARVTDTFCIQSGEKRYAHIELHDCITHMRGRHEGLVAWVTGLGERIGKLELKKGKK